MAGAQHLGGCSRLPRPLATGKVGNRDKVAPVVGRPAMHCRWHVWVRGPELMFVVTGPTPAFLPERLEILQAVATQAIDVFSVPHALQFDMNGSAFERVGKLAD